MEFYYCFKLFGRNSQVLLDTPTILISIAQFRDIDIGRVFLNTAGLDVHLSIYWAIQIRDKYGTALNVDQVRNIQIRAI